MTKTLNKILMALLSVYMNQKFLYNYSDADLHNDWIALRRYSGESRP